MNMPREVSEIERLIEDGLSKYGQGDLDGALLEWEQALAIDPENPQANSYVDYVRLNYELLTSEVNRDADVAPFGIADDEGEYQIEIVEGLAGSGEHSPPLFMDPLDEGWMFEEEQVPLALVALAAVVPLAPASTPDDAGDEAELLTLELEADEPPDPGAAEGGVSFEAATREYEAPRATERQIDGDSGRLEFEPSETTPGFGTPMDTQTPNQFAAQATSLRQRSLGFVKATGVVETAIAAPRSHPVMTGEQRREKRPSAVPPELQMTLRTPGEVLEVPAATATVSRSLDRDATPPLSPEAAALVASLPSPRPAPSVPNLVLPSPATVADPATHAALEIELRPAGPLDLDGVPPSPTAPTRREISLESLQLALRGDALRGGDAPAVAKSATQDFEARTRKIIPLTAGASARAVPTNQVPARPPPGAVSDSAITNPGPPRDPFVSAPTRDLGLRPARASTEDEPTAQTDLRTLRTASAGDAMPDRGGTRTDAMPFDPIDAHTATILGDLDHGAPPGEERSDRTKRRITQLFDRATEWSRSGELDKAVAAVDLALSEDPNSAIAQKLIQRYRDTVQTVFQAFLGDLERQPALARPLHELAKAAISPRAAFLLSRVDGSMSLDEILDVCGMPRLEAFRYLCQLYLRGILR